MYDDSQAIVIMAGRSNDCETLDHLARPEMSCHLFHSTSQVPNVNPECFNIFQHVGNRICLLWIRELRNMTRVDSII